ncbi:MAG: hypothetical protein M3Z13_01865, partial [Candidatus Dormibacteraeota bacterium]|nr:hypothetical protein [Candidatus Dormibacteraeota bacterium]
MAIVLQDTPNIKFEEVTRMAEERDTAVGVFHDRSAADRAVRDLKLAGFRDDQIGYTTPNQDDKQAGNAGTEGGYTSG